MIYTNEVIKKKKAKKMVLKKFFRILHIPIITAIVLLVIYMGYMKYVKHENNISILGFRQYIVATGSMEPKYNVGDLIIGDIINYISENGADTITHRVTDIIEKDGQTYYQTKGDNNNTEDPELVKYRQVKGKLVFKISKLGTIITNLLTGTGIAILFVVILLSYLRDKNKEEKIIARENARKLFNVPKYEEKDS